MPLFKASAPAASVVALPAVLRVRDEDGGNQRRGEEGPNGIQHNLNTVTRKSLATNLLIPPPSDAGLGPPFHHHPSSWWGWPPRSTTLSSASTSTAPTFWTLHPTSLTPVEPVATTQQTPSPHDTRATDMTTAMPTTAASTTLNSDSITDSVTDSTKPTASSSQDESGLGSNRTLVITLSTVLSVVGVLLVAGGVLICLKYRRRRLPRFARGISPIDDDEIETWKVSRGEKATFVSPPQGAAKPREAPISHAKSLSKSSVKKPPSVIIYPSRHSQAVSRHSGEGSPRSMYTSHGPLGRPSLDKELPKTPVQAMAPNARAGLTDEAIPGDDPFVPGPRRHPSRLSKAPPVSSPRSTRSHTRARSSRSSLRSFGDYGYYAGSEMELSPRGSHEYLNSHHRSNSRVYSSSSIPPRLSLGDDALVGGLSPRPLFRDNNDIGRAIG